MPKNILISTYLANVFDEPTPTKAAYVNGEGDVYKPLYKTTNYAKVLRDFIKYQNESDKIFMFMYDKDGVGIMTRTKEFAYEREKKKIANLLAEKFNDFKQLLS